MSDLYPHLKSNDIVTNCGYNHKRNAFKWQHVDGRICYASTVGAAMRQFEADAKQPAYDRDFYAGIIAARMNDPRQHDDGQVSLPDMMLLTGRIDHAQWMALVWPTLPEIAY